MKNITILKPSNNWINTFNHNQPTAPLIALEPAVNQYCNINTLDFSAKRQENIYKGMSANYKQHLNGGGAKRNKLKW
jgi:hypothetical protein